MKNIDKNSIGNINIDKNVISKYAGTIAIECFGIVGMSLFNEKNDFFNFFRKDKLSKGIEVEIDNNEVNLTFHIIVAYGVNILSVINILKDTEKYKLEEVFDIKVNKIKVYVENVKKID